MSFEMRLLVGAVAVFAALVTGMYVGTEVERGKWLDADGAVKSMTVKVSEPLTIRWVEADEYDRAQRAK